MVFNILLLKESFKYIYLVNILIFLNKNIKAHLNVCLLMLISLQNVYCIALW